MKKIKLSNKAQKRILAALLVIAILATSIINDAFIPETKAASVTSQTAIQIDITDQTISAIGTTKTLMWLTVKDGSTYRSVYCLEHGKHFYSGKNLNSLSTVLNNLGYSSKHKTTLAYLLYYGYSNSNSTLSGVYNKATNTKSTRESVEYMATQTLIWMLSKDVELNRHVFPDNTDRSSYLKMYNDCIEQMAALIPSNNITVGSTTYNSQIYFKIYANELANKVYQAQYKMQPSFAVKTNNNSSNISTAVSNASKTPIKLKWDKSKNAYVGSVTDSTQTALSHYVSSGKFSKTTFYEDGTKASSPGLTFAFSKSTATNDTLTITAKEPLATTTAVVVPANTQYKNFSGSIDNAMITWSFGIDGYQQSTEKGDLEPDPVNMAFAISTPSTTASIEIYKLDGKTNVPIQGAEFTLYKYNTSTSKYEKTSEVKKTDANGKVTFSVPIGASNQGKYQVYETKTTNAYYLDSSICVVDEQLIPGQLVKKTVYNTPYSANITVVKQGTYLDRLENGKFKYSSETIKFSGAKFGLYSDKNCTTPVTKDYAGNTISSTATSGADGLATWSGLKPGTYYIKELSANTGYNVVTGVKTINVGIGSTAAHVTLNKQWISATTWYTNPPKTFVFDVVKKDSENGQTVEGLKFTLYSSQDMYNKNGTIIVKKDTAITSAYTDANGKVSFSDLPEYAYNSSKTLTAWKTKFYVKETGKKAGTEAEKYVLNTTTKFYCPSSGALNVSNPPIKGSLTLIKTGDALSSFAGVNKGFVFNSKVNVAGVKFDIIANEDIKDGQGNVKYKKGTVVTTMTTDSSGKAQVSGLYLGSYLAKEVQTGAEYILDTKTSTFTLTNQSDAPSATLTVNNKLHELKIGVIKKEKGTETPVPNTEFAIYAAEDIKNLAGTVIVKKDTLVATAVSDANGMLTIGNLANAKYYAKETKAAPGFNLDTTRIELNAPSKEATMIYKDVYNEQVMAELEVFKTGKELTSFSNGEFTFNTDRPLANVVFSLYAREDIKDALGREIYSKNDFVATATTDANGKAYFTGLIQGKYTLVEESTPEGHIISKDKYDVDLTTTDSSKKVFTIKQSVSNAYDTGEVVVTKKDKETLEVIEGTVLGLYAAEDIKNADGQTIVYKDQLIAEATTNEEGKVTFDNLPHNNFYIKEIEPSDGYKLSYEKVETGEIFIEPVEVDYLNDKMKSKLTVYKIGDEIKKATQTNVGFDFSGQIPLANVEFNLYANGDIYDSQDNLVYSDGETVTTLKTDKNGRAVCYDLTPGKYKLVETVTNEDYYLDTTEYEIDLTYSDGTTAPQQIVTINNNHKKYFVDLIKANDYTGEGLEGSTYGIFAAADIKDKAGNLIVAKDGLVAKGVTDKDGRILFTNLDEADYYILEMDAPDGFNISPVKYPVSKDSLILEEVEIDSTPSFEGNTNVDGSGTITSVEGGVNVTVTDIPIEVEIDKIDYITGELLPGCELEIYTSDGKLYKKFTTTTESFRISAMPAGDYILKETKSIEGYSIAKDVKFTVKQVGEVQKVTMINARTTFTFEVIKKDELTGELLKGAKFEIKNEAGEVVDTITTNANGVATSKNLEMCYYDAQGLFIDKATYYVQEIECPNHLVTSDVYIVEFSDEQIKTPTVVVRETILNYPVTQVNLMKMSVHDQPLEDAVYAVYDEEGYLVEQVRTDKNGVAVFKNAMVEKVYSFKELAAPNGYAVNPNVYSFVAHTDGTIEGTTMIRDDDAIVAISKVDTDTLEALPGAEFELCDLDGNVIMTAISDEYGYAEFRGVLRGSYTIHESDAPAGYDISGQVINIEVTSSYVNTEPILMKNSKTVQTGVEETQMPDNTKMMILAVIIVLIILLLIALVAIPMLTNRRIKY